MKPEKSHGVVALELTDSQVPLLEGSFGLTPEGKPTLLGVKCADCGRISFPRHGACPRCHSTRLDIQLLGQIGTLINCTVAHVAPVGFDAPYVLGELQLDEGPFLLSQIHINPELAHTLRPGAIMSLELRVLGSNELGLEIVGWSYSPLRTLMEDQNE